jgi:hypothetical protein
MTVRLVDNEYYQQYICELADAGHDALTIMKKMMELIDKFGYDDKMQTWRGMDNNEKISIIGMDKAYANVRDLIDLITKIVQDRKR